MDLVDYDEPGSRRSNPNWACSPSSSASPTCTVIPISALEGDNVVDASERTPWYDGPTLLEHLEGSRSPPDRDLDELRLPVQWVARPDGRRAAATPARSPAGTLRLGDEVVVLPEGSPPARSTALDTLDRPGRRGRPALSVTVELADDLDAGRGAC